MLFRNSREYDGYIEYDLKLLEGKMLAVQNGLSIEYADGRQK